MNTINHGQLYAIAKEQAGYFTSEQAEQSGFSRQLLYHHIGKNRVEPIMRGVFRLTHFKRHAHEEFVALWLWSERRGVFRRHTALYLLGLCDAPPDTYEMSVPRSWKRRRVTTPERLSLTIDEPREEDVTQAIAPLLLTAPMRTIVDCMMTNIDQQLIQEALRRNKRNEQAAAAPQETSRWAPQRQLTNDLNKILAEVGCDFRLS